MNNYVNKVAVITGAANGIGKALAIKCLANQMKVVLVDVDKKKLFECEKELSAPDNELIALSLDISIESQVQELANITIQRFGSIHFLFNNAGIPGAVGPVWESSTKDIEDVLQVNLMGTIYGIKCFVPLMLKQNDECYIINSSAGAGLLTGKGMFAYKASKHAITAVSEVLYADLKSINSNINVSLLIPHWVNTDIARNLKTTDKRIIEDSMQHLKNHGMSPTSVAEKVFDAINEKRFYIFTHLDEHLPKIRHRMENILSLSNPVT